MKAMFSKVSNKNLSDLIGKNYSDQFTNMLFNERDTKIDKRLNELHKELRKRKLSLDQTRGRIHIIGY